MAKCQASPCRGRGEIDTIVYRRGFQVCAGCAQKSDRAEKRESRILEILEWIVDKLDYPIDVNISGVDEGTEVPVYERRY